MVTLTASEARRKAREALKGNWGKSALILLIYVAILFVIGLLTSIPLLGLLVASVGSVAAVCTSLALYISKPEDVGFTVGISTDTDVAYTITKQEVPTNNTTIIPGKGLSVEYKLGAALGDNYTQPYVTGKLTVTVSGNKDALKYLQGGMKLTYEQTPGDENASTYFFNGEDQTIFNTLTLAPEGDYSSLTGVLNATVDGASGTKAVLS